MGAFSIWHWIIVLIVVLILFGGKGKLSSIMGDFGKGLKNFKDQVKSNMYQIFWGGCSFALMGGQIYVGT